MKYWFEILIVLLATSCNNITEIKTNDDTAVSINTNIDTKNINNINTNVNTPLPKGIYKLEVIGADGEINILTLMGEG